MRSAIEVSFYVEIAIGEMGTTPTSKVPAPLRPRGNRVEFRDPADEHHGGSAADGIDAPVDSERELRSDAKSARVLESRGSLRLSARLAAGRSGFVYPQNQGGQLDESFSKFVRFPGDHG